MGCLNKTVYWPRGAGEVAVRPAEIMFVFEVICNSETMAHEQSLSDSPLSDPQI